MKQLKNISVGFLVSFLGSIPLGYLNLVGLDVYKLSGTAGVIWYLLGVVTVEVFVIFFTLIFARRLIEFKKLLLIIEAFSVVFMFALSAFFFVHHDRPVSGFLNYDNRSTYILGFWLSAFNFIQYPFWIGWNLYLLNNHYIELKAHGKFVYIAGTGLGTFFGMLVFITAVDALEALDVFSGILQITLAVVFGIMGVVQAVKFYRKYHAPQKQ